MSEHADTIRDTISLCGYPEGGYRSEMDAGYEALAALEAELAEARRERDEVHQSYTEMCDEAAEAWGKFTAAEAENARLMKALKGVPDLNHKQFMFIHAALHTSGSEGDTA